MIIGVGRDKSRRSLTGYLARQKRKDLRRRRKREPQGNAREKYVGMRAGFSNDIYLDEVLDQQFKMHLSKEYRSERETDAILKLTGMLDVMKKTFVWTRGREDMATFKKMAMQLRWDKKKSLSKADATTRFLTGHQAKPIRNEIPTFFRAKPTTRYTPRPGSSAGRVSTEQKGADRVVKDLEKLLLQLFTLREKLPIIKTTRTISKK